MIGQISVDEDTGLLKIESSNIPMFTIRYYLIDAEILFSRSPFVQESAWQFTYIKPMLEI